MNFASCRASGLFVAALAAALCGCVAVRHSPEVQSALGPFVERGEIAGVVSVLSDPGGTLTVDCFGWADAENRRPMDEDTVCAIYSMTKTFTACAIMVAVDRGILSLDDRVSKYLPEFKSVENPITIRECMCHVTGIDGGAVALEKRSVPLREVARRFAKDGKCVVPAGTRFRYGNASVETAAACLEVASGVPFERFLRENVLDPLGMDDTRFEPTDGMIARMAKPYTTEGGPFRPGVDACCAQLVFPVDHKVYPAPAGGLFSTARDMIRFSQMLAHHGERAGVRIVSRKTFDEIWAKKQTPDGIEQPYTVGCWLYGDWLGHEGAMRTDQRANLKTGHSRVFFIQTENKAGKAFFEAKRLWNEACDRAQGMDVPFKAGN